MFLADTNPFVRYAELQPSIFFGPVTRAAYDHRLFYCLSGKGTLVIAGKEHEVREDTAVFLCPGVFYKFTGNLKVMVLNFDLTRNFTTLSEVRKPSRKSAFAPSQIIENTPLCELGEYTVKPRAYEVKEAFHKCVSAFKADAVQKDAYSSAAVKTILAGLISLGEEKSESTREIVGEVMMYIQANFDSDISNGSIAAAFGYHPYYLNRIFKEQTGRTLHKALLSVRLENAKQLLKKTDISIKEVQIRSGFGSRSQFNSAFEEETGVTPRIYRKESRS